MTKKVTTKIDISSVEELFTTLPLKIQRRSAQQMGELIKNEMLASVAKGLSPISGNGRFPEYKAVSAFNNTKKEAKNLKEKSKSFSAFVSGKRKELKNKAKEISASAKKKGYPYSVQKEYPGKKPRPVNLKLSGDFLDSLKYRLKQITNGFQVEIGFFNKESVKKELGHREGANGQPKRPMIPQNDELLNKSIYLKAVEILRQALRDAIK